MKRPLAYITASWSGDRNKDTAQAVQYCRSVYEAGFSPMCPLLYLPLFLNNGIPEEHKIGIDMSRDLLRRAMFCCCAETGSMRMSKTILRLPVG